MMNVYEKAMQLASFFDAEKKPSMPIRVRSSRSYMMKLGLKPENRGEPLFIGTHEIICDHGKPKECTQQN